MVAKLAAALRAGTDGTRIGVAEAQLLGAVGTGDDDHGSGRAIRCREPDTYERTKLSGSLMFPVPLNTGFRDHYLEIRGDVQGCGEGYARLRAGGQLPIVRGCGAMTSDGSSGKPMSHSRPMELWLT